MTGWKSPEELRSQADADHDWLLPLAERPDNLYDGALLLLRSWLAYVGDRPLPTDWELIVTNLTKNTQALLSDEDARQESFFFFALSPQSEEAEGVQLCPWCRKAPDISGQHEGRSVRCSSSPEGDSSTICPVRSHGWMSWKFWNTRAINSSQPEISPDFPDFSCWAPFSAHRIAAGEYEIHSKSAEAMFHVEGAAFAEWVALRLNSSATDAEKLVNATAQAAIKAGIYNGETPLDGPQLLLLLDNLECAAAIRETSVKGKAV